MGEEYLGIKVFRFYIVSVAVEALQRVDGWASLHVKRLIERPQRIPLIPFPGRC